MHGNGRMKKTLEDILEFLDGEEAEGMKEMPDDGMTVLKVEKEHGEPDGDEGPGDSDGDEVCPTCKRPMGEHGREAY